MTKNNSEYGITRTVRTFFSKYTICNIVDGITEKKSDALLRWMNENGICPENVLVIGAYLTGAGLSKALSKKSEVTVLDINSEIKNLLDPDVTFSCNIDEAVSRNYDMIIDTSGFGGIDPDKLQMLNSPEVFIVENPCSEGSDNFLNRFNRSVQLLRSSKAENKGILWTSGLNSKTSGTMTLTIDTLRRSMNDANKINGVLYSTTNMEFFERILFKEKNPDKFLKTLDKKALAVSSLIETDCDEIIDSNLKKINSTILDFRGDYN
ncbi:Protein of unknown function DUF1188 [Methanolacinia petrolearia DSM 11571]|uniref:Uncharacterized protein n=1 Tax=Methanolacinia petrolearia (strain DSM 11571 / OCM 486 / SEBR 4847) TaxID=679926 RepID=E1RJE1_METP4|nr:DUF1188 domain-containing protein [Methanolacinia petrolearia]ADN36747.1 Protein of unknown function DUF1188 [Methanolacinia petrolearia DSM 11571]